MWFDTGNIYFKKWWHTNIDFSQLILSEPHTDLETQVIVKHIVWLQSGNVVFEHSVTHAEELLNY